VTTTATIAAMLRAVRESPDDDTPRLALADVLQETDPDEGGDADWAELIRVQIRLARSGPPHQMCAAPVKCYYANACEHGCGVSAVEAMTTRSDALRAANEARWRRGPKCKWCEGKGRLQVVVPEMRIDRDQTCDPCHGTGHAGPLGEKVLPDGHMMPRAWRVPADFRRGFIASISTPLADVFTPAGDTVTEWAKRVARWPHVCLEEWGLTDREPALLTLAQYPWLWQWHPDRDDTHRLPRKVILAMYKLGMHKDYTHTAAFRTTNLYFDTPDAARLALARAVAATVNEAARERG
jgi:uncharacterized protein (TIGR02996 family)